MARTVDPTKRPSSEPSGARPAAALPSLRSDLEVARREIGGRVEVVLKDPPSNRFFRLGETEWFIARLLDGRRSLADVRSRTLEQFPNLKLPEDEVRHFVSRLAMAGMLRLTGRQDLERLLAAPKRGWIVHLLALPGRLFYLRLPLVNPDRFISWLAPRVRWMGRPRAMMLWGLMILAAVLLLAGNTGRLLEPRAEFLSPRGILWLVVALVVVKVVHEIAHAAVCRNYGGRVSEMGLVLIVFTPCLYCDVSDAWMFPERRKRLAVTAAGIAVELVLAALATVVFVLTRPGWLHQAAFSLMVTASVSTLLFNANPLLRYDGYYLLSDLIEVPNLRLRARRYIAALGRRWVFGTPMTDTDCPDTHRGLIAGYAVASYLYGWFILYAILGIVYRKLEPYGLQTLAGTLIVLSVAAQVGVPMARLLSAIGRMLRTPGRTRQFLRPALIATVLLVAVTVLLSVPVDLTVSHACEIQAAAPIDLRTAQAGFVTRVTVSGGASVERGQRLIVLENRELTHQLERAEADCRANQIRLKQAQAADRQSEVRQLEMMAVQLEEVRRDAKAKVDQLVITTPRAGRLLAERPEDLVGRYFEAGDLLLRVSERGQVKAALEVSERTAEKVPVGSVADLRVHGLPRRTFRGRIARSASTASRQTPAVLTTAFGGDVAVRHSATGVTTAERVYRTEMHLLEAPADLRPGMSGRVRIRLGRRSLGRWLTRTLLDQLSLDVLLDWH
jgi:putative peptide zinc metalloprotease protein